MWLNVLGQGRNHVFKVGGPISWYRVLLPFYRKKLDRSTQFGAIGYIITLFIKKLCKKLGVRPNFGEVWTPRPPMVASMSLGGRGFDGHGHTGLV